MHSESVRDTVSLLNVLEDKKSDQKVIGKLQLNCFNAITADAVLYVSHILLFKHLGDASKRGVATSDSS